MARTNYSTTTRQADKASGLYDLVHDANTAKRWRKVERRDRFEWSRGNRKDYELVDFAMSAERRVLELDMIEQVADAHSPEALKPTGLHQQTAHEQISRSVRLAYTTETPTKQTKPSAPRRFRVRTSRSDYVAMPSEREHPLGLVRPAFC